MQNGLIIPAKDKIVKFLHQLNYCLWMMREDSNSPLFTNYNTYYVVEVDLS